MNILWLSKYKPGWDFNHWFHIDFAYEIGKQSNITLRTYGEKLDIYYPYLNLISYKQILNMDDLYKIFKFDIIIIDGMARVTSAKGKYNLLPKDFKRFNKTPKIVIEGDYHNYKNKEWYSEKKISAIFHRHSSNVERGKETLSNIKHIWLPCSVDNTIFKSNPNIIRKEKICFIGGLNPCYPYRIQASKRLEKENLIHIASKRVMNEEYIKYLQSYISHINCSSVFNIETAKMFEIMASGSVLLTDKSIHHKVSELFDKDSYCTYRRDYTDLIKIAKHIIKDKDFRKYITDNAIKCIANKHTHTIRAKELLQYIRNLYDLC